MKHSGLILIFMILLSIHGCVRNYVPSNLIEDEESLVVDGLITDQQGINMIKLSKSLPLWRRQFPKPVTGCKVSISDDNGQTYNLKETATFGTYVTDPTTFRGIPGRTYTLHIKTTNWPVNYSYDSQPVMMIPAPPIDSIYYEKKVFGQSPQPIEGCNIYLDTRDPTGNCKFFRWEYSETWEFHLPYSVPNRVCWISDYPKTIVIRSSANSDEERIRKFLINSITNPVDKLSEMYSILVNQFSLNEGEYIYWQTLKNSFDQAGGLYDVIPAEIPNNIYCVEDPLKLVLGYFSVSSMTSKRIFISDNFAGLNALYYNCISDTILGTAQLPRLNDSVWVLIDHSNLDPPVRYTTTERACADCTARGTNVKPSFWPDGK